MERLEFLKAEVARHKQLYEDGIPEITDAEYDDLYFELEELLEREGMNLGDSPISEITAPTEVSSLKKVKHKDFVGSLDKCKTPEKFESWCNEVKDAYKACGRKLYRVFAQHKCDGLTIVAEYNDGALVQALTRGSGDTGEDVTEAIKLVKGIPVSIPYQGELRIRFEAMIPSKKFDEINMEGNFSNARNLVAGTIRQTKDMSLVSSRGVFGVVFDILYCKMKFDSISDEFGFLRRQGFTVAANTVVNVGSCTTKEIKKIFDEFYVDFNKNQRDKIEYKIDGIVFKVEHTDVKEYMGQRFNNPRWAIALKFPSLDATTILRNVEWGVGRTGRVSPVGLFDVVDIDNVNIEKATLHNPDYIKAKKLHIGDTIVVARQNDVIPAIIASTKTSSANSEVVIPDICPCCGNKLELVGANLYCTNASCEEQVVKGIIAWCEKGRANIDGLSEKRIRQMYDAGFIKTISDIYSIPDNWKEISELPRFGVLLMEKIIESINESKDMELDKFIYGLGIPGVGPSTAKDIAEDIERIEVLTSYANNGTDIAALRDRMLNIYGIGDVVAEEIAGFVKNHVDDIETLASLVNVKDKVKLKSEGVFADKTFVFTGTLSRPRHEFEKIVISNGGKVGSSVTKATNYLVVGAAPGSKAEKAKKLGIRTLTESEFFAMII